MEAENRTTRMRATVNGGPREVCRSSNVCDGWECRDAASASAVEPPDRRAGERRDAPKRPCVPSVGRFFGTREAYDALKRPKSGCARSERVTASRKDADAAAIADGVLAAGPEGHRYLRIQVTGHPQSNEMIALVGHELRHALEVAESPAVRDQASLIALYERIGHRSSGAHHYDTVAAQDTGRQVRAELAG